MQGGKNPDQNKKRVFKRENKNRYKSNISNVQELAQSEPKTCPQITVFEINELQHEKTGRQGF